jgi:hypothetical protein
MTGVEFFAAEIVGGVEADSPVAEFFAEIPFLTFETLELRLRSVASGEAHDAGLEQGGNGCGLLGCFDAGQAIEFVIHADRDVFHGGNKFSQFHSVRNGIFGEYRDKRRAAALFAARFGGMRYGVGESKYLTITAARV